ncbi:LacI family transcriptional regulator [Luteococcus japonicus]|uniref:HTH-type transcriptional regulator celR n=2 Tax=Luteococcus japonicus TaxID=33984 RepID=A0A1R4KD05_9ACTN|nr:MULTISPECIES: LacI family DNA-binding transcriptional regulator [Luteococcus]MDN5562617.1 LacI family transcriptional regulator [Luteococcus sp.]ROR54616.1 LacI family transcriptional regulator [Luteococcus japonicus]SJN42062.1 HTH-type transcriptional regulator celR [Luteococcus japonicus LSP_Lj1]
MRPDSSTPTLDDVARLAGVSRATASRVLNSGTTVHEDKRRAVEAAVAKLGYVPNHLARALATQRAGVVALMLPENEDRIFSDPFFSQLYHGALQGFTGSRTRVVLSVSQPGDAPDAMARYLSSGHLDGAIVASHHGWEIARQLHATGRPVVFIGDPGISGAPYVDIAQEEGVRLAVDHLVARGATRIATITGPLDMVVGRRRLEAFRDTLADHGLMPVAAVAGGFTREGGEAAAQELLAREAGFDGLFVASDLMARGALRALRRAGREVPRDLLLASFDDSVIATESDPQLTSVGNPAPELAAEASRMLRAILAGEAVDSPCILPTRISVRESA